MQPKLLISKPGDQGRSIALLHMVLRALDFSIEEAEVQEQRYGDSTAQAVRKFQHTEGLADTEAVDLETAGRLIERTAPMLRMIHGQVRHIDGNPVSGLLVRAWNRTISLRDTLLDETISDEAGGYALYYFTQDLGGKDSADLVLRVLVKEEQILHEEPVRYSAGRDETIDLILAAPEYRGASEYEKQLQALQPLLGGEDLAGLTLDQITYLANKTGLAAPQIEQMVVSRRQAGDDAALAGACYAMLREAGATDSSAVFTLDRSRLERALDDAQATNLIPLLAEADRKRILDQELPRLQVAELLRPAGEGQPASLGDLLDEALSDGGREARRQDVAGLFLHHRSDTTLFRETLRDSPIFADTDERKRVELALDLGELSGNDLPLVRELQRHARSDPRLTDLRDFAAYDLPEWRSAVRAAGEVDEAIAQRRAAELFEQVEARFPTAVIASRIRQGRFQSANGTRRLLAEFFAKNPAFEFGRVDLPAVAYLKQPGIWPDGAAEHHQQAAAQRLLQIDRLFKITPGAREIDALLAAELYSAYAIAQLTDEQFVARFSPTMGEARARHVHAAARQVHHAAALLYINHHPAQTAVLPYAISGDPDGRSRRWTPDLAELFGSLDFCDCPHCVSLYSPAAYLTDILRFLGRGPENTQHRTPLDELLRLRPDIGETLLNCPNTNTRLPHIDLVNEALETEVVVQLPREIGIQSDSAAVETLDRGMLPVEVRDALRAIGLTLTETTAITPQQAGRIWQIREPGFVASLQFTPPRLMLAQETGEHDQLILPLQHTIVAELDHGMIPHMVRQRLAEEQRLLDAPAATTTLVAGSPWVIGLGWSGMVRIEPVLRMRITMDSQVHYVAPQDLAHTTDRLDNRELTADLASWIMRLLAETPAIQEYTVLGQSILLEVIRGSAGGPWTIAVLGGDSGATIITLEIERSQDDQPVLELQGRREVYAVDQWDMPIVVEQLNQMLFPDSLIEGLMDRARTRYPRNFEITHVVRPDEAWEFVHTRMITLTYQPHHLAIVSLGRQTSASEEELAAYPEHLNPHAYARLQTAIYPWSLPFDLWQQQARVSLEHLGVQHHELMEAFHSQPHPAALHDAAIVHEYLGLSQREADLITGKVRGDPDAQDSGAWNLWGFPRRILNLDDRIPDPADPERAYLTGDWALALMRADIFLQQSGLSLIELRELLEIHYLQPRRAPGGRVRLELVDTDGVAQSCDLHRARIQPSEPRAIRQLAGVWANIPRFVRLARKLGWRFYELDTAITAFQANDLDEPFLSRLALVQRLRHATGAPLASILSWFADRLDTSAYTDFRTAGEPPVASLYDQVFRNRASAQPLDPIFELDAARTELHYLSVPLTLIAPVRTYAPPIAAALNISVADLELLLAPEPAGITDQMRLDTLSRLYRITSFARTLRLPIRTFLTIWRLSGTNPFDRADPLSTLRFVDHARTIRASGFRLEELDYLLRHQLMPGYAPPVAETTIGQILKEIRTGLQTQPRNNTAEPGEAADRAKQRQNIVIQQISLALGLEVSVVSLLLTKELKSPVDNQKFAMDVFLSDAFISSTAEISFAGFPAQFRIVRMLSKVALLATRLKITPTQFGWLVGVGRKPAWLDINSLPTTDTQASAPFDGWERLVGLFQLRDALPDGEALLSEIFRLAWESPAAEDDLYKRLRELLGWEPAEVRALASALALSFPNDYRDEQSLARLLRCFQLMERLGVPATTCIAWAQPTLDETHALAITQTVQAHYDRATWQERARPLRDLLRIQQRDALVAYLVARDRLRDADDVYERCLIDVQIDACMLTTRLKQAISATQLFVQRLLMRLLEDDTTLSKADAQEWRRWRKQYRVWEANRKIFLYPENWLEPELRDDKSPFFKELENELLQNDITEATAETALLHYLERLDQVARLEIVGMYHEQEAADPEAGTQAVDRLHVFGRTYSGPYVYFYRRLERGIWSPWEQVDLDIEGNCLIPVVWNRRLYLFWPLLTQKERTQAGSRQTQPETYWQIKLAWSIYENGGWTGKRMSSSPPLENPYFAEDPHGKRFYFQGSSSENNLQIICYGPRKPFKEIEADPGHDSYQYNPVPDIIKISFDLYDRVNGRFIKDEKATVHCYYKDGGSDWSFWFPVSLDRGRTDDIPRYSITLDYDIYKSQHVDMARKWLFVATSPSGSRLNWEFDPTAPQHAYGVQFLIHFKFDEPEWKNELEIIRIGSFGARCGNNISTMPAEKGKDGAILHPPKGAKMDGMLLVEDNQRPAGDDALYLNREGTFPLLQSTPGTYRVLVGHQFSPYPSFNRFFYQDNDQVCYIELVRRGFSAKYIIHTFFHPQTCEFTKELMSQGLRGLFDPKLQGVLDPYRVDYEPEGAYSLYNWELFFYIPLLIAVRFNQNQRFEEAQKWFHYLFDPTAGEDPGVDQGTRRSPARFWKFYPFHLMALKPPQTLRELLEDSQRLQQQLAAWEENPFMPHVIARLRILAYMKIVVMTYIDNLLDWADMLFRQDRPETIEEAAQLYVLAAHLLGRKPQKGIQHQRQPERTYNALRHFDPLNTPLVQIEQNAIGLVSGTAAGATRSFDLLPYFCMPGNDRLPEYWERVADRLFKLRHCMNIDGIVRQLPIFEPPIPPELLVRAAAAGIDLRSALSDVAAPLPHYRFTIMVQKATELCGELKALGAALLAALEKRDAEHLATLRSNQEIGLQRAVKEVRKQQVLEAHAAREALEEARAVTQIRYDFYLNIPDRIPNETNQLAELSTSQTYQNYAQIANLVGSVASLFPDFSVTGSFDPAGRPTGYSIGTTIGGSNFAEFAHLVSGSFSWIASLHTYAANIASILGGWERRRDDWNLQRDLAAAELDQINKQIAAADIRKAIADLELVNQEQQIENARDVAAFLRDRYTNRDLYHWMVGQVASIYFQAYTLAYDVAKRAERAFRFELGVEDTSFIQFGYWDNLKKGLLAGEKLAHDLKRMEVAYLEQNRREYEITKHISLLQINPHALITLKETGACTFELPEALFDLDFPGHFFRRIKSVSLTIPCVVGPYTSVNSTLTLLSSSVRRSSSVHGTGYTDPENLATSYLPVQSIATSSAQNDSGLFELNFRDERYLPFEGAGVISRWRLEISGKWTANGQAIQLTSFDFGTIADIVLHMRYTSREGGEPLRNAARTTLMTQLADQQQFPQYRLFSLWHEYPNEWHRLVGSADEQGDHHQVFAFSKDRFPYLVQNSTIVITHIELFALPKRRAAARNAPELALTLRSPNGQIVSLTGTATHKSADTNVEVPFPGIAGQTADWTLSVAKDDVSVSLDRLGNLLVVCRYEVR